ncbi:MAG TPA: hypothetical protein ENN18_10795 [Proteobacteria bacterium]|nr:hypothetical protein [Pseudomonadota bacterium]
MIEPQILDHPKDLLLRKERIPHIWCPGCGLGSVLSALVDALKSSGLDFKNVAVVSGIGCTGRAAGYLNLDSFHTTHGRAIPYATGLKLANPDLTVIVFSGDGDLAAIGGNHLIHAARRNVDIKVICVNNFNYGMTGGQGGPTTPRLARTTTTIYGNTEKPFNLVHLMAACGAPYVARWTSAHPHYMKIAMGEMLKKDGFSFLEVIAPCPTNFGRRNKLREIKLLQRFLEQAILEAQPDIAKADIELDSPILCGKFVDLERPSYLAALKETVSAKVKVYDFRGDGRVPLEEAPVKPAAAKAPGKPAEVPSERPIIQRPVQIKLAGLGGQGIGLCGLIIGRAAAIFDHNQAVYTQEYSPEARGGASASSIIIASGQIHTPYVTEPDIMVIMAQGAYNKYQKDVRPGSRLIIDKDLVRPKDLPDSVQIQAIPSTRLAEELGQKVVANIVILGFFTALVPHISLAAMQKALKGSIPKGTEELNLRAFETGYNYGKKMQEEEAV